MGSQFGWAFFGFGMIFFWAIAAQSETFTGWKFLGTLATTTGTVTSIEATGSTESYGKNALELQVYVVNFVFTPAGSTTPLGNFSYVTGTPPATGTAVMVEYQADHPQHARIQGMRSALYGADGIFAILVPLPGLCIVLWLLICGLRNIRLLHIGATAVGMLVSAEMTSGTGANAEYRTTFQFTATDGRPFHARMENCRPKAAWIERCYAGNAGALAVAGMRSAPAPGHTPGEFTEAIFYDPLRPANNLVLAELGPRARVDDHGKIHWYNPAMGILSTVIPLFVLLVNGGYLWHLLRR
jgi:hypothetical protein